VRIFRAHCLSLEWILRLVTYAQTHAQIQLAAMSLLRGDALLVRGSSDARALIVLFLRVLENRLYFVRLGIYVILQGVYID
jgi:hypothetical protein